MRHARHEQGREAAERLSCLLKLLIAVFTAHRQVAVRLRLQMHHCGAFAGVAQALR